MQNQREGFAQVIAAQNAAFQRTSEEYRQRSLDITQAEIAQSNARLESNFQARMARQREESQQALQRQAEYFTLQEQQEVGQRARPDGAASPRKNGASGQFPQNQGVGSGCGWSQEAVVSLLSSEFAKGRRAIDIVNCSCRET